MKQSLLPLLLCICALSFSATAQKLKTDVLSTGDTLIHTSDEKIYTRPGAPRSVGDYLKVSVYKYPSKGTMMLEMEIQTGRTSVFSISAGSAAALTLQNEDVVTLYARNENQSRISRLDYGCYIFVFYTLTADDRARLKASPVTSIRVSASMGAMEYDIKSKFGDTISNQISKF